MAKAFPIVGAVDIGSRKICVLLAELTPDGLQAIGFGEAESHGVRKGVIVNIDTTVHGLSEAFERAASQSNRPMDYVVVGVAGSHIQCLSSQGMVPIREKEVRSETIQKALEAASAVNIPLEREIIQIVPQSYTVDDQDSIQQPLGMFGKRLEVSVQIITGSITPLENIRRCLQKAGVRADRMIAQSLASARAVLNMAEKEAGVCCVDIGASSTDLAVFQEGGLRWIRSLPVGGHHLTSDLAVGLKTTLADAEKLKHQYGCTFQTDLEENVMIPGLTGQEPRIVQRRLLTTILQPRMDEILMLVRGELAKEGLDEALPSGVVITGGAAHLIGMMEASERVFRLPVRLGKPQGLGGLTEMVGSPSYSTAVGLLQLAFEESEELRSISERFSAQGWEKFKVTVSHWVRDFF